MSGNLRLDKEGRFLRIKSDGHVKGREIANVLPQFKPILRNRNRMLIDNAEVAVVVMLQIDKLLHCADIVAEGNGTARLNA